MRRPLPGIALCFLLGTGLGFQIDLPVRPLLIALVIVIGAALLRARLPSRHAAQHRFARLRHMAHPATGLLLAGLGAVLAGTLSARAHLTYRHASPLPDLDRDRPRPMELVGVVSGDPHHVTPRRRAASYWSIPLTLRRIRHPGQSWADHTAPIKLLWYGPRLDPGADGPTPSSALPAYGETWQLRGRLREGYRLAPGSAAYIMTASRREAQRLDRGPMHAPARLLLRARRTAARILSIGIQDHPATTSLLQALLLGYRKNLPPALHELFATTGTLHMFAISGLHVGILCGLLIFLLSALGMPRTRWIVALAPLLIAYTFATGAKASAVRACVMALIYFSAPLVGRKADRLSALALAALLIVAASPPQLFQVGFILSFTVVLGLIILYPMILRAFERLLGHAGIPDDLSDQTIMPLFWERDPAQRQDEPRHVRWTRGLARSVVGLAALSCAAWLASAPLTAYFFGRFAPIALVANLLVIPLAFLIVLCGCLSLVTGSCLALGADIFNHANLVLVDLLVCTMRAVAAIPGGSIPVRRVPLGLVLAWYALLATLAGCAAMRNNTRKESTSGGRDGKITTIIVDP